MTERRIMDELIPSADCESPGAPTAYGLAKELREPTVTERLADKRQRLAQQLAETDEALAALKANPEIERVLNLVQRASRR